MFLIVLSILIFVLVFGNGSIVIIAAVPCIEICFMAGEPELLKSPRFS
jgi:hypothetical protein